MPRLREAGSTVTDASAVTSVAGNRGGWAVSISVTTDDNGDSASAAPAPAFAAARVVTPTPAPMSPAAAAARPSSPLRSPRSPAEVEAWPYEDLPLQLSFPSPRGRSARPPPAAAPAAAPIVPTDSVDSGPVADDRYGPREADASVVEATNPSRPPPTTRPLSPVPSGPPSSSPSPSPSPPASPSALRCSSSVTSSGGADDRYGVHDRYRSAYSASGTFEGSQDEYDEYVLTQVATQDFTDAEDDWAPLPTASNPSVMTTPSMRSPMATVATVESETAISTAVMPSTSLTRRISEVTEDGKVEIVEGDEGLELTTSGLMTMRHHHHHLPPAPPPSLVGDPSMSSMAMSMPPTPILPPYELRRALGRREEEGNNARIVGPQYRRRAAAPFSPSEDDGAEEGVPGGPRGADEVEAEARARSEAEADAVAQMEDSAEEDSEEEDLEEDYASSSYDSASSDGTPRVMPMSELSAEDHEGGRMDGSSNEAPSSPEGSACPSSSSERTSRTMPAADEGIDLLLSPPPPPVRPEAESANMAYISGGGGAVGTPRITNHRRHFPLSPIRDVVSPQNPMSPDVLSYNDEEWGEPTLAERYRDDLDVVASPRSLMIPLASPLPASSAAASQHAGPALFDWETEDEEEEEDNEEEVATEAEEEEDALLETFLSVEAPTAEEAEKEKNDVPLEASSLDDAIAEAEREEVLLEAFLEGAEAAPVGEARSADEENTEELLPAEQETVEMVSDAEREEGAAEEEVAAAAVGPEKMSEEEQPLFEEEEEQTGFLPMNTEDEEREEDEIAAIWSAYEVPPQPPSVEEVSTGESQDDEENMLAAEGARLEEEKPLLGSNNCRDVSDDVSEHKGEEEGWWVSMLADRFPIVRTMSLGSMASMRSGWSHKGEDEDEVKHDATNGAPKEKTLHDAEDDAAQDRDIGEDTNACFKSASTDESVQDAVQETANEEEVHQFDQNQDVICQEEAVWEAKIVPSVGPIPQILSSEEKDCTMNENEPFEVRAVQHGRFKVSDEDSTLEDEGVSEETDVVDKAEVILSEEVAPQPDCVGKEDAVTKEAPPEGQVAKEEWPQTVEEEAERDEGHTEEAEALNEDDGSSPHIEVAGDSDYPPTLQTEEEALASETIRAETVVVDAAPLPPASSFNPTDRTGSLMEEEGKEAFAVEENLPPNPSTTSEMGFFSATDEEEEVAMVHSLPPAPTGEDSFHESETDEHCLPDPIVSSCEVEMPARLSASEDVAKEEETTSLLPLPDSEPETIHVESASPTESSEVDPDLEFETEEMEPTVSVPSKTLLSASDSLPETAKEDKDDILASTGVVVSGQMESATHSVPLNLAEGDPHTENEMMTVHARETPPVDSGEARTGEEHEHDTTGVDSHIDAVEAGSEKARDCVAKEPECVKILMDPYASGINSADAKECHGHKTEETASLTLSGEDYSSPPLERESSDASCAMLSQSCAPLGKYPGACPEVAPVVEQTDPEPEPTGSQEEEGAVDSFYPHVSTESRDESAEKGEKSTGTDESCLDPPQEEEECAGKNIDGSAYDEVTSDSMAQHEEPKEEKREEGLSHSRIDSQTSKLPEDTPAKETSGSHSVAPLHSAPDVKEDKPESDNSNVTYTSKDVDQSGRSKAKETEKVGAHASIAASEAYRARVAELLDVVFGPVPTPKQSVIRLSQTLKRFEGRENALIRTLERKVPRCDGRLKSTKTIAHVNPNNKAPEDNTKSARKKSDTGTPAVKDRSEETNFDVRGTHGSSSQDETGTPCKQSDLGKSSDKTKKKKRKKKKSRAKNEVTHQKCKSSTQEVHVRHR